jgi:hypothetical protein
MRKNNLKNKGFMLVQVIIFSTVAVYILGALISWAVTDLKSSNRAVYRESAFQIAEAGIDYYRWHLSQAPTDYQDGTEQAGPYVHDFYDKNDNIIGQFTLEITPPPNNSNIVTIKSTGEIKSNQNIKRTIVTKFDFKSKKYVPIFWKEIE